ncbi:hypothetical protein BDV12DRAFT_54944 [Aspergillus spectabilis]
MTRVKRPELQNSAQPRAKANAKQTRIIGTKTNATTIIAVFCLGFMAIPILLDPILPCKNTIGMEYSDVGIDIGTRHTEGVRAPSLVVLLSYLPN